MNTDDVKLEDCLEAVIERRPDNTVLCVLLESGARTCEQCMEIWEKRQERFGK